MSAAGIPPDDLEELWRLKLKFAGGSIKPPHDLIDVIPVSENDTKISGGLSLRRDGKNRYTFSCGSQVVSVDMNLPKGKDWSASYKLNNLEVNDGYFSVIHIGEGNGWDPEKPCMGSLVSFRGRRYLIDAGGGIDYSLETLGIDISEIRGLFVTHVHDDHFAGLTSLLRGDTRINVYATRPVAATLRFKLADLLERQPDFMDHLVSVHYLEEDRWNDIDGLEVRPTMSPHPLETTIMFFRALWEGGYKSYAHLADIISSSVLRRFMGPDGITEKFFNRVFSEYRRPSDVKKVDVGRGLIHGYAEDFIEDASPRLILSHFEGSLSDAEKEIGANVSFGQVDTLIPARGERLRETAADLLSRSIPGLLKEDYDILLNNEVQSIAPNSTVVKKNTVPESLLLIITGTVDALESASIPHLRYAAGSLVGEHEFLNRQPAVCTYRSRNHIKAMRIPADLYVYALKRAKAVEKRLEVLARRKYLHESRFPGQVVSCPRLDDLAGSMKEVDWRKSRKVAGGKDELYILISGAVEEYCSGNSRTLKAGDFMNLSAILAFTRCQDVPSFKATEESRIAVLPGAMIRETPVLAWTLVESDGQS
jgi:hemerythrin